MINIHTLQSSLVGGGEVGGTYLVSLLQLPNSLLMLKFLGSGWKVLFGLLSWIEKTSCSTAWVGYSRCDQERYR